MEKQREQWNRYTFSRQEVTEILETKVAHRLSDHFAEPPRLEINEDGSLSLVGFIGVLSND